MLSNPRSGHGAHVSPFVSSKQGGKKKEKKNPQPRLSAIREITALDFPLDQVKVSSPGEGIKGRGIVQIYPKTGVNRLPRRRNNSVGTAFVSDRGKMAGQIGACLRKRENEANFRFVQLTAGEREREIFLANWLPASCSVAL